jgi:hypothetical protein
MSDSLGSLLAPFAYTYADKQDLKDSRYAELVRRSERRLLWATVHSVLIWSLLVGQQVRPALTGSALSAGSLVSLALSVAIAAFGAYLLGRAHERLRIARRHLAAFPRVVATST